MDNKNMVYIYSVDTALQNDELDLYRESRRQNIACAKAIDNAITDSNYELYRYDMKTAVKKVIDDYGTDRVTWVLANTLQNMDYDGRFSRGNKEWAKTFEIPKENNSYEFTAHTHPVVLEGFIHKTREIYAGLNKEQMQGKPSILGQMKDTAASINHAKKKDTPQRQTGLEV